MERANLLVSSSWPGARGASHEIRELLGALGDPHPVVRRTAAKGLLAVATALDARTVVRELRALYEREPGRLRFTCKWAPVDAWTAADLEALREAVEGLRERIGPGQRWRMTVDKHRHARYHRDEVVRALAPLVDAPVDLTHPDRILKIDLIGAEAALAVVSPEEIFSTMRPPGPPPGESPPRQPADAPAAPR